MRGRFVKDSTANKTNITQKQPKRRYGFFSRAYSWAVFYALFLILLVLFILLYSFAIPRAAEPIGTLSAGQNPSWATSRLTTGTVTNETTSVTSSTTTGVPGLTTTSAPTATPTTTTSGLIFPESNRIKSYKDEKIQIELYKIRQFETDIYIADIHLASAEYLRTAFAQGKYGRNIRARTSETAAENKAILAINGDYYGARDQGFVLRNGLLYRDTARSSGNDDALLINRDGSFAIINERKISVQSLAADAWQILTFGPALLNQGLIPDNLVNSVPIAKLPNPRAALGQVAPFHYLFIVADGRTSKSRGLTLPQLAQMFLDLDCRVAYNLDGGGSATMWFSGQLINKPADGNTTSERKVSDIVYIGYP
jgi:exopolysaccharide biosynthesis protein